MSDNNSGENFFKGLVFGALGGAILGILFAPDEGKKTRKRLKRTGLELRDKAIETAEELEEVVGPWVEEAKEGVKDVVEHLEDASEPVRKVAKEKLEDLEKELTKTKKSFFKKK